jgi:hypothetical protein
MEAIGWIAAPIISELFKECSNYLKFDATKKLRQLGPKVILLERAIEVFEKIPDRARLEQLFVDLKIAFYEAEDILDDVEYHCLEKKIQDGKSKCNGGESPRKRDWVMNKVRSASRSSPSENKVMVKYDGGVSQRKRDWLKNKVPMSSLLKNKVLSLLSCSSVSLGSWNFVVVLSYIFICSLKSPTIPMGLIGSIYELIGHMIMPLSLWVSISFCAGRTTVSSHGYIHLISK